AFGVLTVAHMLGVMRAACVTRDFDWAFARLQELWEPYQRSLVHRSAFVACLAHSSHARLVLNHHVETGASTSAAALARTDLANRARLPGRLSEVPVYRIRARIATLEGDRQKAIEIYRTCVEQLTKLEINQEYEHDRFALGKLLGGAEGQRLVEGARA